MGCGASTAAQEEALGKALHEAATQGRVNDMDKALKDGAYVDWSEAGKSYTPLMAACWNRHENAALELIRRGARVNIANTEYGSTALHIASFHGLKEAVEALLACEADFDMTDKNGKTALDNAKTRKHMEIVRILTEKKTEMYGHDESASKDLFQAAKTGAVADIQRALDRNADVNWSEGGNQYTALMIACWLQKEDAALDLIKKSADVDIQNMQYGTTALHLACQKGLEKTTGALLQASAKVGIVDKTGKTPLDYAKRGGNAEVLALVDGSTLPRSSLSNPAGEGEMPSHWLTKDLSDFPAQKWLAYPIETGSHIYKVMQDLLVTDPSNLGKGRDVSEKGVYSSLQLACAWRIENINLWRQYAVQVASLKDELTQIGSTHKMPVLRVRNELYTAIQAMPMGMKQDLNELMMLHGLKPETVLTILQNGPNMRFSSGSFGKGTYLAEDAGKADQYVTRDTGTDPLLEELHTRLYRENPHPGNVYYVLVCRALMGFICRTNSGYADATDLDFSQPVYATADCAELSCIPGVVPPVHYHSLVVETGAAVKRYREFVQFHEQRLYPEFLIAYHRKA